MTDQQRIDFEARGYLILEKALPGSELDEARRPFDAAPDLSELPNHDSIFIHLSQHAGFFPHVHRIIGDVVQLRSITGSLIVPGDSGCGWHRAPASMLGVHHPLSTVGVVTVLHLDPTADDDACVAVVPGSHRFRSELSIPDVDRIEEMPHAVRLNAAPGTVLLLHANIWQARLPNATGTRRSLTYVYNHCWMRQALPALQSDAQGAIAASHNLSQLFGIGPDLSRATGYWSRSVEGYPSSHGLPERKFSELKVVGQGVKPNK